MMQAEQDIQQYIQNIDQLLFGSKEERQEFLASYETSIREEIQESGLEYDYAQLELRFGTPVMVAENYVHAFQEKARETIRKNVKKKILVSTICALVIIICFLLLSFVLQKSAFSYLESYIVNGIGIQP